MVLGMRADRRHRGEPALDQPFAVAPGPRTAKETTPQGRLTRSRHLQHRQKRTPLRRCAAPREDGRNLFPVSDRPEQCLSGTVNAPQTKGFYLTQDSALNPSAR